MARGCGCPHHRQSRSSSTRQLNVRVCGPKFYGYLRTVVDQRMNEPPLAPPVSRASQATVYHRWLREMRRMKSVQFVAVREWPACSRHSVFVRPVTLMGPHADRILGCATALGRGQGPNGVDGVVVLAPASRNE